MASRYTPQVVALIDTASGFGATLKQLKDNVTTLQTQVSTLLADAPETLDTLNEIAAAISDDPAFFSTMSTANTTLQNNIDAEATTRATVVAALQALVDAATTARGLLSGRLDTLEADATTGTALAAVQADVDGNEADADAAIALRAPIDNPTFTTKIASPEFHSDGGHLKFKADTNDILFYPNNTETLQITRHSGTGHPTFTANGGTGEFKFNQITDLAGGVKLAGTTVTASAAEINAFDSRLDTLEADPVTKTYVDTQVTNVIDAAPGALDTLNELAAALGDDANFATTITNSIAAVQADVNQNETDADTAIAAVQADVDANEADADAALALKAPLASPAFTGTTVSQTAGDTDPTTHTIMGGFPDLILKTNQGDFATHQNEGRILWDDAGGGSHGAIKMKQSTGQTMDFFVGGVTAGDKVMSIASDSVDVESLKINGTAVTSTAAELNYCDGVTSNIQTQLNAIQADVDANESDSDSGIAAANVAMLAAVASQNTAMLAAVAAVQSDVDTNESDADTAIALKFDKAGGALTGNLSVAKSFPDIELKAGDERRILFSDAGGGAQGGFKFASNTLKIFAGGGIAGGNEAIALNGTTIETKDDLVQNPGSSVTPAENGEMMVEATNNTTLTFKLKGSDGTVRSGTITLS